VYRAAAARAVSLVVSNDTRRSDPATFFHRLVAHTEKHGPKVEIRFRSRLGKSHNTADTHVRLSAYFSGNASLPSRHFGPEQMRQREAIAASLLISALQPLFPPEIARFELGEALASPEPDEKLPERPEPAVPTLFIDHRTELSGGYVHAKPRGIFMGAGIFFDTVFVIPGDETVLEINVPTWRTPSRQVMDHESRTIADVYEDLARRSFALFLRRYLERVLKEPPELSMPEVTLAPADEN
jgi:hypothetical protein